MNEHVYNAAEVLAVLDLIVAEKPEGYTYADDPNGREFEAGIPWCEYFRKDGCPACIIGHVLHRLSISVPAHQNALPFDELCDLNTQIDGLFTAEAKLILRQVQYKQDAGVQWEEAVRYGRVFYRPR